MRWRDAVLLLCATALTGCFTTLTAPETAVAAAARQLSSASTADWREVLSRHVDDRGLVDYAGLAAHREPLDRFVAQLAVTGPESTPELYPTDDDRLAFYINAYNALVLFNVLSRPELRSVDDSKVDFFYFTCFRLDGAAINLYGLENDVVRARFHEPRAHMALNCASRGCPRLPREPFEGPTLHAQLARETALFLNEPRNVSVEDGVLVLSRIFDWYAEDFAPDATGWIRAQAPDLELPPGLPVRFRAYDWGLNAQTPPPQP